jgi:hypothetical protein
MENWEFFLQQVGEEDWLRVESTQPDFPSGRYRIAARAQQRPHELIEIEVKTRPNKQTVARTTKRQQTCQLDGEGFGILISEIELTPGVWEIQCRGDILSAFMGEDWTVTLSLQATLNLEQASIEFNQENQESEAEIEAPEETGEALSELRSRIINDVDQTLEAMISELFSAFESREPQYSENSQSNYFLHLDQDILLAETTKPIIVSGQVMAHDQTSHANLRLNITLRDPQTGEPVAKLSPLLPKEAFPLTFCYSLTLPSPCESYLLQGEITLYEATSQEDTPILDRQPFTVTANWEKLEARLVSAITPENGSHPPAPLSPLSHDNSALATSQSSRWRGVLPPKLASAGKRKKTTPPQLPKLPQKTATKQKEYVWSKPDSPAETFPLPEWELIPELVIISTDETQS